MEENPYQAPSTFTTPAAVGVLSGTREDLRSVAKFQKGINVCILIYLIAVFSQFAIPEGFRLFLGLGFLALAITGAVFVFQLAIKVYGTGLGILLGILTLIPIVGLFVLLIVNGKATKVLKQNGIAVGLLGANLSEI